MSDQTVRETERRLPLSLYLARFPRTAKSLQIPLEAEGRPSPPALSAAAGAAVVVVVELVPQADA